MLSRQTGRVSFQDARCIRLIRPHQSRPPPDSHLGLTEMTKSIVGPRPRPGETEKKQSRHFIELIMVISVMTVIEVVNMVTGIVMFRDHVCHRGGLVMAMVDTVEIVIIGFVPVRKAKPARMASLLRSV